MSINDFLLELDKKDKEIERLKKQISYQNKPIKTIDKQSDIKKDTKGKLKIVLPVKTT